MIYQKGKFVEAESELEQGMQFVRPGDPTKARWDRLVAECRRLGKLEPRLIAHLKGEIKLTSAAELCDLALLCAWPNRRLYGEAARLYDQAFALEPSRAADLRLGYRYHAAGCAARAGSAGDSGSLTVAERSGWRAKALEWFSADLAVRRAQIKSGKAEQARDARAKLRYWQTDADLAGVRDTEALARMAETESDGWRELWRAVASLVETTNDSSAKGPRKENSHGLEQSH
jgi:hypothetical protein